MMTPELLTALVSFAFVSSITPGPNNLMLMASGANFGFRRTLPHMFGVGGGFVLMLIVVGLGLGGVFAAVPQLELALKVVSVAYLLFLAWKIANAAAPGQADGEGRPMTFLQAAAFQWVNPKAWTMAVPAALFYAPGQELFAVLQMAAVFGLVNVPSVSVWTLMGQQLRRVLTNPARLRAFNWLMAALLVGSLYVVLKPGGM